MSNLAGVIAAIFVVGFMFGGLIVKDSIDDKITEGKTFKIKDANYKCEQVLKLEYGE